MRDTISATIRSDEGFYVGDICYVLGNEIYYGVWGEKYNFREGSIQDPESGRVLAVAGTAYGEGSYIGSDGTSFSVDAAVIGLVPLELVGKPGGLNEGKVVKIPGRAIFWAEDGKFEITFPDDSVLTIDTSDEAGYGEGWDE